MKGAMLSSKAPNVARRTVPVLVSASTHSAVLPSAPAVGNVVLFIVTMSAATSTITTEPPGFTRLFAPLQRGASAFMIGAWWRRAQSGDSATTSLVHSTAVNGMALVLELGRVADPGTVAPDATATDGGGTNITTLTVGTTATHPGIAVAFIATNGNAGTINDAWDGGFKKGITGPNRIMEARKISYAAGALSTHNTWTTIGLALGFCGNFAAAA